ncbi:hypothetical protein [Mucilaginibacter sp. HD30]
MSNHDNQQGQPSMPTYIAYQVSEGGQAGYWTRIGAAWPHKDGKGYNINLECLPRNGRVTMRLNEKEG